MDQVTLPHTFRRQDFLSRTLGSGFRQSRQIPDRTQGGPVQTPTKHLSDQRYTYIDGFVIITFNMDERAK